MKVSVDLDAPTPYLEAESWRRNLKRRLGHRHYINLMRRYLPADAEVLDVGTGSGSFLQEVQRNFAGVSIRGIEYDPRLVSETNRRIGRSVCAVGNAESFSVEEDFDLIASFQVIEHLYDPEAFLRNCRSHLRPGGYLLITTPNLNSIARRLRGNRWHGFRPDHVSLKSSAEWGSVICDAGFRKVYVGTTFLSGLPAFNSLPLGVINWSLLLLLGSARWPLGESFVGLFKKDSK